jgi:hypothetical protein
MLSRPSEPDTWSFREQRRAPPAMPPGPGLQYLVPDPQQIGSCAAAGGEGEEGVDRGLERAPPRAPRPACLPSPAPRPWTVRSFTGTATCSRRSTPPRPDRPLTAAPGQLLPGHPCKLTCSPPTNAPSGSTPASSSSKNACPRRSASKPGGNPGSAHPRHRHPQPHDHPPGTAGRRSAHPARRTRQRARRRPRRQPRAHDPAQRCTPPVMSQPHTSILP